MVNMRRDFLQDKYIRRDSEAVIFLPLFFYPITTEAQSS